MALGRRNRFLARWLSLSGSGAAASASTFVVFALVARTADASTLGKFVLTLAVSQGIVQIVDAGYGLLVVREALATARIEETLSWALRRRFSMVCVVAAIVGCVLLTAGWALAEAATTVLLALVSAGYGFLVLANQTAQRFRNLSQIQLLNAFFFVAVGLVMTMSVRKLSVLEALAIPVIAFAAVDLAGFWSIRAVLRARPVRPSNIDREAFPLIAATIANGISANADSWIIGLASPVMLATYAANQRPAYGLGSISIALALLVLPALYGKSEATHRKWARRCLLLALLAPFLGIVAGVAGETVLSAIYGSGYLVRPALFGVIACAYGLGMLTVIPSASLVYLHRTPVLRTAAVVHAVIMVIGISIALVANALLVVGVTLVVGSSSVLLIQVRGVLRKDPDREVMGDSLVT